MKGRVMERVERVFRPEFIGRCDDIIVFRHLTNEDLKRVIDLELGKVRDRLAERGLALELTDSAKEFLIKKGSNLDFGARPLRRAIEQHVEDPLSENLLQGVFQGKDKIVIDAIKDDQDKPRRLDFRGEVSAKEEPVAAGGESK
jgi:ATP-dependent Clp protease ATP-binding subunit ClpC